MIYLDANVVLRKLKNAEVFTFDEKLLKTLKKETSPGNGTNSS